MIDRKKKLCNNCNTEQFIWKNDKNGKYCKSCWYKTKKPTTKLLKVKPISFKSKNMIAINSAYVILRRKFMEKKPMCEAALPGCGNNATDVHHKKGRGKYYLDVSTWLSTCRQCHSYIEEHPQEAIELGFSEKRI